jgi:biopolymer transport protein ExbB
MGDGSKLLFVEYFKQGGVAMYPLLLCSVLCLAIGFERIWVLLRAARGNTTLGQVLERLLGNNQPRDAVEQCANQDSPLARAMQAALAPQRGGPEQREKALQRALSWETVRLERHMSILATIGSVSPFVGLFGTVLGIMRAFRDIGLAGSAGGAVVAAGIAEALVTTATGLCVAVIAVIAYNHLMTWAQGIITNTELNAEEFVFQIRETDGA